MLAQQRVESKSNEITAIRALLNLLDIQGATITLDAMGTQRDLAAQIIDQGGNYILALKGNQGKLHKGVEVFFKAAEKTQWEGIEFSYSEYTEAGHHRIEHRQGQGGPHQPIDRFAQSSEMEGVEEYSDGQTPTTSLE